MASVLALCSALGACSFVSVRSAPRRDSDGRYRCASYALPTGDLLVLTPVAGVATMGAFVGYMFTPLEQEPSKLPHIGLGLATIAALSSSIYGYSAINLCHGRQRELEAAEDARTRKDARARKDAERREAASQDVRVHAGS